MITVPLHTQACQARDGLHAEPSHGTFTVLGSHHNTQSLPALEMNERGLVKSLGLISPGLDFFFPHTFPTKAQGHIFVSSSREATSAHLLEQIRIIESWDGRGLKDHLIPILLPWVVTPTTRPCCSRPSAPSGRVTPQDTVFSHLLPSH